MIGLLILFWIGKYFYKLAEQYNQNKWLFGILGVVSYYFGTFIGGLVIGLLDIFFDLGLNWDNDLALGFLALPFGILICYLFYILLEKKWKKEPVVVKESINDIGKTEVD